MRGFAVIATLTVAVNGLLMQNAPTELTNNKCKVICQRFGMKML
eukprot:CAMPEP_0204469598 /NCGR_PEP_ID=MMETSP0471-20130131/14949_1 /ASSEMBLY_ACC=CAM_ASM_000602 /TAXON_ID=2969 /ORGANISM="Oxyrrhis marina" /LENGTH=43 /DNA_ID= /DNA_START= /DNA_END= /DNA_ORIENTATION=